MTPLLGVGIFDAFRRSTVDDSENATPLFGLREDHFHGIGSGAIESDDFRHLFQARQDIDGEAVLHNDDEAVAGADGKRVVDGGGLHVFVVAVKAHQAGAGSFVERHAELHLRHCVDDGFVNIFDGLDEMRLAEDDVGSVRYVEPDRYKLHRQ